MLFSLRRHVCQFACSDSTQVIVFCDLSRALLATLSSVIHLRSACVSFTPVIAVIPACCSGHAYTCVILHSSVLHELSLQLLACYSCYAITCVNLPASVLHELLLWLLACCSRYALTCDILQSVGSSCTDYRPLPFGGTIIACCATSSRVILQIVGSSCVDGTFAIRGAFEWNFPIRGDKFLQCFIMMFGCVLFAIWPNLMVRGFSPVFG